MNYYKRVNKTQQEKIKVLSSALQDTQSLVCERNKQIRTLEEMVRNGELAADVLHDQKMELGEQCAKELEEHEAIIAELTDQFQDREKLAVQLPHTFSSRAYSTNMRTLYFVPWLALSSKASPVQYPRYFPEDHVTSGEISILHCAISEEVGHIITCTVMRQSRKRPLQPSSTR